MSCCDVICCFSRGLFGLVLVGLVIWFGVCFVVWVVLMVWSCCGVLVCLVVWCCNWLILRFG